MVHKHGLTYIGNNIDSLLEQFPINDPDGGWEERNTPSRIICLQSTETQLKQVYLTHEKKNTARSNKYFV